jgi:hypothetical protein
MPVASHRKSSVSVTLCRRKSLAGNDLGLVCAGGNGVKRAIASAKDNADAHAHEAEREREKKN